MLMLMLINSIYPRANLVTKVTTAAPVGGFITWKRCKIGSKLLLITNRKSHMGFRLVPKSVTLNDLKRRNGRVVWVISPNLVAFVANYVKWLI